MVGPLASTSATSADDVRALFSSETSASLVERRREDVLAVLRGFAVASDANDEQTAHVTRPLPKDAAPALTLLEQTTRGNGLRDGELLLVAFTHLKILARDPATRAAFGDKGIAHIVKVLGVIDKGITTDGTGNETVTDTSSTSTGGVTHSTNARTNVQIYSLAAEASNTVLNACHHSGNVDWFCTDTNGGVQMLLNWLDVTESTSKTLRRNAAGAMQSVCFEKTGRRETKRLDGVSKMLRVLFECMRENDSKKSHDTTLTIARLTGAIHNATTDLECVRDVRTSMGNENTYIPLFVNLLRCDDCDTAASAAGVVQNIAREKHARAQARSADAVPALGELLITGSTTGKAHAAGALVNLLGPELSGEDVGGENLSKLNDENQISGNQPPVVDTAKKPKPDGDANRCALGKLLSSALALSMAWEMIHETRLDRRALA